MTTIITRLYSDDAAHAAVAALASGGFDADMVRVIPAGADAKSAMGAARISDVVASAYAAAMKSGHSLVVVEAGFNPVGAARKAMKILAKHPSIDVGLESEDNYIREFPDARHSNSIMAGNPLVLSNPYAKASHGHILGSNPVSRSKPRTSAIRGGAYMSKMFWPMALLSKPRSRNSAIAGGKLFSDSIGIMTIWRR